MVLANPNNAPCSILCAWRQLVICRHVSVSMLTAANSYLHLAGAGGLRHRGGQGVWGRTHGLCLRVYCGKRSEYVCMCACFCVCLTYVRAWVSMFVYAFVGEPCVHDNFGYNIFWQKAFLIILGALSENLKF